MMLLDHGLYIMETAAPDMSLALMAVSSPRVIYGKITDPWWEDYHQDLPYVNEEFNDQESLRKWRQLGFTQYKFTGDMYDMRNIEPMWINPFREVFNWNLFSWSVYRMGPGTVLPNHGDTYARFRHIHNIENIQQVFRAVVFLEDWQSGHYAEYDNDPFVEWSAGDYVIWQGDTLHTAANVGFTNRYTLQITGIPHANPFLQ